MRKTQKTSHHGNFRPTRLYFFNTGKYASAEAFKYLICRWRVNFEKYIFSLTCPINTDRNAFYCIN